MDQVCDKVLCTGCSACANICPKQSITMKPNVEGFLYPNIDNTKCINCNLCQRVCPINNNIEDTKVEPLSYAAKCKNTEIREKSSSGGAFTLIAESIISKGGVVFGAGYDEKFRVIHKVASTIEELSELRGSKYVQSVIGNAYKKTKEYLDNGIRVLFTGTPCQIGGLYAYLKKDYDNLYSQDIICHGVPSPMVWEKYLDYIETTTGAEVKGVSFRDKSNGWKQYSLKFQLNNNRVYCNKNIEDPYLRSFIMNMDLRKSCEKCAFKKIHRDADITLSDLWGVESMMPDWNDDKGVSCIMIHNRKGEELFELIKKDIDYSIVDFKQCLKNNPSMVNSVPYNFLRKGFFRDVNKLCFDRLHKKYCGNGFLSVQRRNAAKVIRKIKEIS